MNTLEQPSQTDDLPLLTTVVDKDVRDDLPTLTEIVEDIHPALPPFEVPAIAGDELPVLMEVVTAEPPPVTAAKEEILPPAMASEADMQQLLQRIEAHIESVLTQKLSLRLEQLQQQAIEQTVTELKAELPQILHDALGGPDGNRQANQIAAPRC